MFLKTAGRSKQSYARSKTQRKRQPTTIERERCIMGEKGFLERKSIERKKRQHHVLCFSE